MREEKKRFETWQCSSRETQPRPPWPIGRKSKPPQARHASDPASTDFRLTVDLALYESKRIACLVWGIMARLRAPPTGIHISDSRLARSPPAQP
jgi:hypothetical protein